MGAASGDFGYPISMVQSLDKESHTKNKNIKVTKYKIYDITGIFITTELHKRKTRAHSFAACVCAICYTLHPKRKVTKSVLILVLNASQSIKKRERVRESKRREG